MNDPHLGLAKIKHLAIRDRILADNPGIDDQTLADTVEGLSELPDKLAAIMRDALRAKAMAAGLQKLMDDNAARLKRFEDRGERLRALVRDEMLDADISKLQMPDFTASLRKASPALGPIDENLIPKEYWEDRPHLQRGKLLDDLKAGYQIEGATLKNQDMTLAVRTR